MGRAGELGSIFDTVTFLPHIFVIHRWETAHSLKIFFAETIMPGMEAVIKGQKSMWKPHYFILGRRYVYCIHTIYICCMERLSKIWGRRSVIKVTRPHEPECKWDEGRKRFVDNQEGHKDVVVEGRRRLRPTTIIIIILFTLLCCSINHISNIDLKIQSAFAQEFDSPDV